MLCPPGCQSSDVKPEVSPSAAPKAHGAAETPQRKQIQALQVQESAGVMQRLFRLISPKPPPSQAQEAALSQHFCIPKRGKSHLLQEPSASSTPWNTTAAFLNVTNSTCSMLQEPGGSSTPWNPSAASLNVTNPSPVMLQESPDISPPRNPSSASLNVANPAPGVSWFLNPMEHQC